MERRLSLSGSAETSPKGDVLKGDGLAGQPELFKMTGLDLRGTFAASLLGLGACSDSETCPTTLEVSGTQFAAEALVDSSGEDSGRLEGFTHYTGCSSEECGPDSDLALNVQVASSGNADQDLRLQSIATDLVGSWGPLLEANRIKVTMSTELLRGVDCGAVVPPDGAVWLCVDPENASALKRTSFTESCSHYTTYGELGFGPALLESEMVADAFLLASRSFGEILGLRSYEDGGFEPTVMSDSGTSFGAVAPEPSENEAFGLSCILAPGSVSEQCLESLGLDQEF